MYSPYCSLYISYDTNKENLFNNQELLWLVIVSFIFRDLDVWIRGWFCKEKLDTNHS